MKISGIVDLLLEASNECVNINFCVTFIFLNDNRYGTPVCQIKDEKNNNT